MSFDTQSQAVRAAKAMSLTNILPSQNILELCQPRQGRKERIGHHLLHLNLMMYGHRCQYISVNVRPKHEIVFRATYE